MEPARKPAKPYKLDRHAFFLDQVDTAEFCRVLRNHLPEYCCPTDRQQVLSNRDKSQWLVIDLDREFRIKSVAPAGLTTADLNAIQRDIKEKLIDNQGDAIGQLILLSSAQVEGRFLYKQEFQVAPAPANIPRMEHIFGEHPYLLQLRYKRCLDKLTSDLRIRKRAFEIIPILNGITRSRFFLPTKYTTFHWGRLTSDPVGADPKRFRDGYLMPQLESGTTTFCDGPLVKQLPMVEYYRIQTNPNYPLVFPDNLGFLLDNVFSLSPKEYQKLHRACMWFAMSRDIWLGSSSATFVSIVSALESLITSTKASTCKSCGQQQYQVSKLFKKFIHDYAPRSASKKSFIKQVYGVRSKLTHGAADLMRSDVAPWELDTPERPYQEILQQDLFDCASEAIVNWLLSKISVENSVQSDRPC